MARDDSARIERCTGMCAACVHTARESRNLSHPGGVTVGRMSNASRTPDAAWRNGWRPPRGSSYPRWCHETENSGAAGDGPRMRACRDGWCPASAGRTQRERRRDRRGARRSERNRPRGRNHRNKHDLRSPPQNLRAGGGGRQQGTVHEAGDNHSVVSRRDHPAEEARRTRRDRDRLADSAGDACGGRAGQPDIRVVGADFARQQGGHRRHLLAPEERPPIQKDQARSGQYRGVRGRPGPSLRVGRCRQRRVPNPKTSRSL